MQAEDIKVEELLGKVLVDHSRMYFNNEANTAEDALLQFKDSDGTIYQFIHRQDCCEYVNLEEVVGDLEDLINSPILEAEEVSSEGLDPLHDHHESYTWTFYKLGTQKGFVTLRFYGNSNGYYSESVDFIKFTPLDELPWEKQE